MNNINTQEQFDRAKKRLKSSLGASGMGVSLTQAGDHLARALGARDYQQACQELSQQTGSMERGIEGRAREILALLEGWKTNLGRDERVEINLIVSDVMGEVSVWAVDVWAPSKKYPNEKEGFGLYFEPVSPSSMRYVTKELGRLTVDSVSEALINAIAQLIDQTPPHWRVALGWELAKQAGVWDGQWTSMTQMRDEVFPVSQKHPGM